MRSVAETLMHCWFVRNGCFGDLSATPAFLTLGADIPYSLAANTDWVQATIARPLDLGITR